MKPGKLTQRGTAALAEPMDEELEQGEGEREELHTSSRVSLTCTAIAAIFAVLTGNGFMQYRTLNECSMEKNIAQRAP